MKIYEAPEAGRYQHILDWGPQCNPFVKNSKLALALSDQVYLIDHLTGKNSIIVKLNHEEDLGH
jgi:hypothetical protein